MPKACGSSAELISYARALAAISEVATRRGLLPTELVELGSAHGRILAEDLASRESLPHYDNSAVDGFAVRSAELARLLAAGSARLRVAGRIVAGDQPPSIEAGPGTAWEIMTGAPFPAGYDCSLKVEDVEVVRDASRKAIELIVPQDYERPEPGDGVRPAGEDFKAGQKAVSSGTRLAPQHLMAAAALGAHRLSVRCRPRVAVISTGQEVREVIGASGDLSQIDPGQVRNSTLPYLNAELARLGCLVSSATVGDDPRELWSALERALASGPELIITTGGVSMGIYDHVGSVAADLGARAVFHRVSIRPGKPILFSKFDQAGPGMTDGPVLFGLPGNPLSTVVGVRFFVEPYLRARLGQAFEAPIMARLSADVRKPDGLRCFFKARLAAQDGQLKATVLRGQASFMISPLLESNAWVVLGESGGAVAEGAAVEVYPLRSLEGVPL